jgi:L-amino acid N-acyltransferase YncA
MTYSDLPLSDALLIENGAYRSVSTIARTIEHSVPLAAQYNAGGLTGPLVKAAIDEARAHLVSSAASEERV